MIISIEASGHMVPLCLRKQHLVPPIHNHGLLRRVLLGSDMTEDDLTRINALLL